MNCKTCNQELKDNRIYYQYDRNRVIEWIQGHAAHEKYEYLDAGIFCSDECLIDYLVNKKI